MQLTRNLTANLTRTNLVRTNLVRNSALMLSVLVLSACGGGSSAPSQNFQPRQPAPPSQPTGNQWQQGVFAPDSQFKDLCEAPRSGVDINGNPFPDEAGTLFDEQMWLRSWSNDTYLWYDEIIDQDPADFDSAVSYFNVLRTNETTASGAAKDNFHFSQSTEEYQSFSQTGTSTGYGINWAFVRSSPPRDIVVSTVEPNSSASDEQVQRGDKLLRINGIDVVDGNQVDALNAALFPSESDVTTEFVFERSAGEEFTVNLISGNFATSFVNNTKIINTDEDKIAYVRFEGFQRPAQTPLINSFQLFSDNGVTELVLDLRYNGGGLLAMASQLAYMIAGPDQTDGRTFETLQFNDKYPNTDPVTGNTISPTPFYTREIDWEAGVLTDRTLPSLSLNRVYVITTADSCSASEALINGLRGVDVEVVQIGNTTCGKPFGFYPTDNCGTTYFTIQFKGVNDKGFGEYANGFSPSSSPQFPDELPGCTVNDDFSSLLGDESEGMLSTALSRIQTGTCPSQGGQTEQLGASGKRALTSAQDEPLTVFDPRYRSLLLENKINTPIKETESTQ